jgi:Xaa-Pro aminopeptidase
MGFSQTERERRHKAMLGMMKENGFKALILMGDTNVGNGFYGDFRYYVDNRVIFYRQVACIFADSPPVLIASSIIQSKTEAKRGAVKDTRVSEDIPAEIVKLFKERGMGGGRIGVNFESLPVAWYEYLKRQFPGVEWVESHDQIMRVRFDKSEEEGEIARKCARLADGGYEAAVRMIKPGVTEFEIAEAIEGYARERGAEQHFTLIGSGRFVLGDSESLALPYSPSFRKIESGDSVVMEISPCYEGYWTQIARTVNVGRRNPEIEKMQAACRAGLEKTIPVLKPGSTIKDVVTAMDSGVKATGYVMKPPVGHLCGADMVEVRVAPHIDQVLKPWTAVIIHPTVYTPDLKNQFFWGETYLITKDGFERLNKAGDQVLTV